MIERFQRSNCDPQVVTDTTVARTRSAKTLGQISQSHFLDLRNLLSLYYRSIVAYVNNTKGHWFSYEKGEISICNPFYGLNAMQKIEDVYKDNPKATPYMGYMQVKPPSPQLNPYPIKFDLALI